MGEREQIQTELGILIDSPMSVLKEHLRGKNIGYVRSLIVLMENTYHQLVNLKDTYLNSPFLSPEKIDSAVSGVYAELFKIEEKIAYLNDYEKTLKSLK